MPEHSTLRRFAAGLGGLALVVSGLALTTTAANAAPGTNGTPPGEAPDGTTGSITVHKYVNADGEGVPSNGQGPAPELPGLGGVEFTLSVCEGVDLTTAAGWAEAQAIYNGTEECDNRSEHGVQVTDDAGATTFGDLPLGLYWLEETDAPEGVTGSVASWVTVPFASKAGDITTWLYDVNVYPKNTIEGEGSKTLDAVTGSGLPATASWTLASPPLGSSDIPATSTSFSVNDDLGGCMTLVADSAQLTVKLPNGTSQSGSVDVSTAGSVVTFSHTWAAVGDYPAGTTFQIAYDTTVTCIANDNGSTWNDSDWGADASWWGELQVTKKDATKDLLLDGAEFAVYAGTCPADEGDLGDALYTGTTENGLWTTGGLYVGKGQTAPAGTVEYCLRELKAPAGYVTPAWPQSAQTVDIAAGKVTATTGNKVTVTNTPVKGPDLPLTGSTGTLAFGIVGLGLIAAAGAVFAVRRSRAKQH